MPSTKVINFQNYELGKIEKQTAPKQSTVEQLSDGWSHLSVLIPKNQKLENFVSPKVFNSGSRRVNEWLNAHSAICVIKQTLKMFHIFIKNPR